MLGHEYVCGFHVLAAGSAKTDHVPVVDDPVVRARQQEHPVFTGLALARHDATEHVPRGGIDAARERPASAQAVATRNALRRPRREHHRRCDQRGWIGAPDFVLARDRPEREHPVVHRIVRPIPGGGAAASRQLRADVDQHDGPGQLRSADAPRLQHAHQSGFVELADRLFGTAAQLVSVRGTFLEPRHKGARTRQRLVGRENRRCGTAYDFGGQRALKRWQ